MGRKTKYQQIEKAVGKKKYRPNRKKQSKHKKTIAQTEKQSTKISNHQTEKNN